MNPDQAIALRMARRPYRRSNATGSSGRTMVGANVVAQFPDRVHDAVKLLQQGGDVLVVADG